MERRDMVKLLATLPLATWSLACNDVETAAEQAAASRDGQGAATRGTGAPGDFTPAFFNLLEWRSVQVLADMVIPRDARSGSATDAAVPEFMDFIMAEYPGNQARMRNGLGWLNAEARRRFAAPFPDLSEAQRVEMIEEIAWPKRAKAEHRDGVQFFNAFRDLTATGFFSSEMGVRDLEYRGNVANATWQGCPPDVLRHIGLTA